MSDRSRSISILAAWLLAVLVPLGLSAVQAQRELPSPRQIAGPGSPSTGRRGEFTFARLRYATADWGGGRRRGAGRAAGGWAAGGWADGYSSWMTDYPKADQQFIYGLRGWVRSNLDISDDPVSVAISDPAIFTHPFIYVVEPGQMDLSREDAASLREYLLRGGFLILDDFWGAYEWENVRFQLARVFPEYQLRELPLSHPIFHCYFDIDEVLQTPNFQNIVYRGQTAEKGGTIPSYWGLFDEADRLMVFVGRNLDNGDAWEWIDDPRYPLKYGLGAYKIGANVIFYAMTH
jgi:hypothetical protein